MAEIYRATTRQVNLDVLGSTLSNVQAFLTNESGEIVRTPLIVQQALADPQNPTLNRHYAYVGLQHTTIEQTLVVEWEFMAGTELGKLTEIYEVVTPLISISEIKRISGWTDPNDIADLERRVRYAIQTYCGQSFGKFFHTYRIRGTDGASLQLPAKLLEVHTAPLTGLGGMIIADGWSIGYGESISYSVKQTPPDEMLDTYYSVGPIMTSHRLSHFSDRIEYVVSGVWGYHSVPNDVAQAARMLAADYACDESLWRDRYMDSVRAGNWRFELNAGAFSGTGNVFVDQILEGYRSLVLQVV